MEVGSEDGEEEEKGQTITGVKVGGGGGGVCGGLELGNWLLATWAKMRRSQKKSELSGDERGCPT